MICRSGTLLSERLPGRPWVDEFPSVAWLTFTDAASNAGASAFCAIPSQHTPSTTPIVIPSRITLSYKKSFAFHSKHLHALRRQNTVRRRHGYVSHRTAVRHHRPERRR